MLQIENDGKIRIQLRIIISKQSLTKAEYDITQAFQLPIGFLITTPLIALLIANLLYRRPYVDQNPHISHQSYGFSVIDFQTFHKPKPKYAQAKQLYYQNKYQFSKYPKQLPICVVIPSYNNQYQNQYLRNIDSVFKQNYSNYHVTYFDDLSTDNTVELVQKYKKKYNISDMKLTIVRSPENIKPIRMQFQKISKYCQPHEIYVKLDGDDSLLGTFNFQIINTLFQKQDIWFAYSNQIDNPSLRLGLSRQSTKQFWRQKKYRKSNFWITVFQKYFYAKLYSYIKQQSLKQQNGTFLKVDQDRISSYYITELSGDKVKYIEQVMYAYNMENINSDFKTRQAEQIRVQHLIQSRKQQNTIQCLFYKNGGCMRSSEYALQFMKNRIA